jgi:K+-transporting ATPase ATPase C chain
MRKDLVTSALAVVAFTLLLGVAFPLLMTGISQVAFPSKANGSVIKSAGKVVGSKLLAQPFVIGSGKNVRPNPRYFQARPSQTDYGITPTAFSNRGPNQKSAMAFYQGELASYLELERPFTPGLTAARVPVDAVTTSASGVDPEISLANAHIQANRVARVRRVPLARVLALVDKYTAGRFLGVFGEPGVNVTQLNLALDRTSR